MRDILIGKLERLKELEQIMGDPELVTDQKRFREVNVEYKHLRDLADCDPRPGRGTSPLPPDPISFLIEPARSALLPRAHPEMLR